MVILFKITGPLPSIVHVVYGCPLLWSVTWMYHLRLESAHQKSMSLLVLWVFYKGRHQIFEIFISQIVCSFLESTLKKNNTKGSHSILWKYFNNTFCVYFYLHKTWNRDVYWNCVHYIFICDFVRFLFVGHTKFPSLLIYFRVIRLLIGMT